MSRFSFGPDWHSRVHRGGLAAGGLYTSIALLSIPKPRKEARSRSMASHHNLQFQCRSLYRLADCVRQLREMGLLSERFRACSCFWEASAIGYRGTGYAALAPDGCRLDAYNRRMLPNDA